MKKSENLKKNIDFDSRLSNIKDEIAEIGKQVAVKEFWGLPLFLSLFAVTFTLFVLLVSIYETLGSDILPYAGVFIFLSAIFWVLAPILKEKLPQFAANVFLTFLYLISAQILLLVSGGLDSPLFIVYAFVVFTGAFSYGLSGSIVVTLLVAFAYSTFIASISELPLYLIRVITLWIVALMIGFLAEMKKKVERRETLQNLRLVALSEIARFMRELSKPDDVLDAGLEALVRLLGAKSAVIRQNGRNIFSAGSVVTTSAVKSNAENLIVSFDTIPLILDKSGDSDDDDLHKKNSNAMEVVLSRPESSFSKDEERIACLLIEKMYLIWTHLNDKSAIEHVRAEKERVLDLIGSAVITVSDDGTINTLNQKAVSILEIEQYDPGNKSLSEFDWALPEPDSFGEVSREVEIKNSKGEKIPVEMRIIRGKNEEGLDSGWIIIFEDLKEIRRLSALMRRSESLAAVGEMASRIAHEIRNPLGGILGFLGLAEKKASGEILRYVRQSRTAVMRLETLVRDLLTFARPFSDETGEFQISDFWSNLEQTERAKDNSELERPRAVIEPLSPSLVSAKLKGNSYLFGQALNNIMRNAKEAAGADGSVAVRVRNGDPYVWFEVDDDGAGWGEENAEKLFEPFFSTKETGSGLGLAIAKRIIERFGGAIKPMRIEYENKMITRFRFSWPRA